MLEDRKQESRVRSLARRAGYSVKKSRRAFSSANFGDFMLVDEDNSVVMGSRFDATLDDIEVFLAA
jgi:hypothetical protein